MKKLATLFVLLISVSVFATEDIGKEIQVVDSAQVPGFGMQIAHDSDYGFEINMNLSGSDLKAGAPCFVSLAYRFYSSATGTYISDWQPLESSQGCMEPVGTYPIQFGSTDATLVKNVLSQLPNIKVVFALNYWGTNYKATSYVDLGKLCQTHPEEFQDMTMGKNGCSISLQK